MSRLASMSVGAGSAPLVPTGPLLPAVARTAS